MYSGLASHKNPLSDSLSYLGQYITFQLQHGLPVLQLIAEGNPVWRSFRIFLRDPASALEKQSYYDLSSQMTKVIESLAEPLLKRKVGKSVSATSTSIANFLFRFLSGIDCVIKNALS